MKIKTLLRKNFVSGEIKTLFCKNFVLGGSVAEIALKACLIMLVAFLLFPPPCFAGSKMIWCKKVVQAGEIKREAYRTTIGKSSKCDIIIYTPAPENRSLFVNAYDKDQEGRVIIQTIKITKNQDGSVKKEDFRFKQECRGG